MSFVPMLLVSLMYIGVSGCEVPIKWSPFREFLRGHSVALGVLLVHRSISYGVASTIYQLSPDPYYRVLMVMWHMALPIGMFAYYTSAKRRANFPNFALIGLLFLATYVVETHALFTIVSQHDVGWISTREDEGGLGATLANQVVYAMLVYALVSVGEELLFRVTLFEVFQKIFRLKEAAIVLGTGVIFGALHILPYFRTEVELLRVATLYNVATTTLLGLILGLIYARHRDLLLITFLHWWVGVMNIGGRLMAGLLYLWLS
ncbi:MAG: CPBP family intramembrane metalloprotease [Selenomonadales bacterium]|nr:CPBP family intramembrane metalloprotease [Selenomonadales bacterium]